MTSVSGERKPETLWRTIDSRPIHDMSTEEFSRTIKPSAGQTQLQAFQVMAKTTGALCNLDCKYCFYLEKEKLYPGRSDWTISDEVLESYVRQYIEAQRVPVVTFAWQGGEPTLLGVDFFRKVVALQKR